MGFGLSDTRYLWFRCESVRIVTRFDQEGSCSPVTMALRDRTWEGRTRNTESSDSPLALQSIIYCDKRHVPSIVRSIIIIITMATSSRSLSPPTLTAKALAP
jgi:hypothetical protein